MDNKNSSKKTPADTSTASTSPATPKSTTKPSQSQSIATPPVATDQSTSPQPVSPTPQPAIMNSVVPPKKKTGLIIGIITGSIVLLLAIVAVLLYFLWWRDPQTMVTNAIANSFQTKKAVSSGKLVMNLGGGNQVDIKIKAAADMPKSKTEATIKLAINGIETRQDIKLTVVADGKGTMYIKSEHLKDVVHKMVETIIKLQSRGALSDVQSVAVRDQILKQLDEKLDRLEGKWLKISPDDFDSSSSDKCSQEVFGLINSDQQVRRELINIYRKNSFILVKKDAKVEPRDGVPGFEIDLASDGKALDRLRAFIDALRETKLGKKIRECYGDKAFDAANKNTAPSSKGMPTVRVWIDPWSHQLKAVEIRAKSVDSSKQNVTMDMTFDYNKSEQIDIPANAESLKSVIQELVGSSSIPPFARGGVSVDENDEDTNISVER